MQLDIRVFHRFGIYGLSAVSALTAQSTLTVSAVAAVEEEFLGKQLHTLLHDIRPDALKTGMLYSAGAIRAVVNAIKEYGLRNLVIDPVTRSSTGASLMEGGALDVMINELFPLSRVITPNIHEASFLSGIPIRDESDLEKAAVVLHRLGPETVVITGGHLDIVRSPVQGTAETVELIYDGQGFQRIKGEKIVGEFHGTGCAFSAAVTALLAGGASIPDAVMKAKEFVTLAIENSLSLGSGMKLLQI